MTAIEVFLSYDHQDKLLVGELKKELERAGFTAFLAHEDIAVSAEWREEIRNHLDSCSGLIAVVTENFASSAWTNQEVGIAIGIDKPIVSLIFGASKILPGFLESLQGIPARESDLRSPAKKAIDVIAGASQAAEDSDVEEPKRVILGVVREFVIRWERFEALSDYEQTLNYQDLQVYAISIDDEIVRQVSENSDILDAHFQQEAIEKSNLIRKFGEHKIMATGAGPWQEMIEKGKTAHYQAKTFLGSFALNSK